jgi:plastocyanin
MANDQRFEPSAITIRAGTTLRWENTTAGRHTVTFDPSKVSVPGRIELPPDARPFDGGLIDPNKRFERTFETRGTYRYACALHERAGMVGTIEVR